MIQDLICAEPWQFGPARKIKPVNRRAQIARERELREFITANRFTKSGGFTRLRTPHELAYLARSQGINATSTEIEHVAARALLAVANYK
jgi:hypothetical protein